MSRLRLGPLGTVRGHRQLERGRQSEKVRRGGVRSHGRRAKRREGRCEVSCLFAVPVPF